MLVILPKHETCLGGTKYTAFMAQWLAWSPQAQVGSGFNPWIKWGTFLCGVWVFNCLLTVGIGNSPPHDPK